MTRTPINLWLAAAVLSAPWMTLSMAHAQPQFSVGQRLDTAQTQSLGALKSVTIAGQTFRLLQTGNNAAGVPYTLLLNAQGTVGQTYHEVQVVEQPTAQVKQKLAAITSQAQEVTYYDRSDITLLRFTTLEQAIEALARAQAAMPGAEIGLPVIFSRPKTQ